MKNAMNAQRLLWLVLFPFLLFSCEDKMSEHYEIPDWLRGNAWEVLETGEHGKFSIFLRGVELAGFRPMMEGKSLLTVMAPDDEAFTAYLEENGYGSISDMPIDEVKKLIGFHLLYYSYNKTKLENFRPEGDAATEEDAAIGAGLYYKHRTKSSNLPTLEYNPAWESNVMVYHLERFVPVFSHYFFKTKKIDAKKNYEYFYPNSTWEGDNGFNVSNASVNEYGVVTDNGYIYIIDKVLKPLETLYVELEGRKEYSDFLKLYNVFSVYEYDEQLSKDYGASVNSESLFLHKHAYNGKAMAPIALEWPTSDYRDVKKLSKESYSLFAPTNEGLSNFYNEYWKGQGYESVTEIDTLVMKHFLGQFFYSGSAVFPEEIEKGDIANDYGMPFDFNPYSDVQDKAICINGNFYGLNKISTPLLFSSVIGEAFISKNYRMYLYMLDLSDMLKSFASQQTKFTVLMPNDEQLIANDYWLLNKVTGNVLMYDDPFSTDPVNSEVEVSAVTALPVVNMHTALEGVDLPTSGAHVIPTKVGYNYWYTLDNGITTSGMYNQYLNPDYKGNPFVKFSEITNKGQAWSNGFAYAYEGSNIFIAENTDNGLQSRLVAGNSSKYKYYGIAQLLIAAGMVDSNTGTIPTVKGLHYILFAPTNEAIEKALKEDAIPGVTGGTLYGSNGLFECATCDKNMLKKYLQKYFFSSNMNVISGYPYIGSSYKTGLKLWAMNGEDVYYYDSGFSLSLKDGEKSGTSTGKVINIISDYHYFPFAFNDGCMHFIEDVF